jgi:uncharacterized membrane-anchored protein
MSSSFFPAAGPTARLLNRVPEVTVFFWVVKVLATTVGETAADFLNVTLGFGLGGTSLVMSGLLALVLWLQFRMRRYVPAVYWLAVVLISVVGTLVSDNLVDNLGVSLVTSTVLFGSILAVVIVAWFAVERTLSVHTIFSARREGFYWATILFTFALGTSGGDLLAERLAVGYAYSALLFAAVIALTYWAYRLGSNAVLTFWIAYIVTRPLGASMGDLLSQNVADGGLGLGTTGTSVLFLATILGLVIYMTVQRRAAAPVAVHEQA